MRTLEVRFGVESICSEWRCLSPSSAINAEHEAGRTPHTAQLIHLPSALDFSHPKVQQVLGAADCIIFQRNTITADVWSAMDYWKSLGKVITVDLDDHYSALPPSNPAHAYWILNKGGMPQYPPDALAEGLRHADALTSPSKVLLKDWEHIVPGFWIPNWPRRAWYGKNDKGIGPNPKPYGSQDIMFGYKPDEENGQIMQFNGNFRPNSDGWIVMGWGGSISHVDSWVYSGICEALDLLFMKYDNLRLKFCGFENRLDYILNRWGDKIIRQAGVKPEHWPYVVSTFDIGLAPLDMRPVPSNTGKDGEVKWEGGEYSYDERRSWLKGVEYMCAGVPWVATCSATYEGLAHHGTMIENGNNLTMAQRQDNWYRGLDNVISTITSKKKLAEEKKKWALKRMTMEGNVNVFAETYERIANLKRAGKGGVGLPNIQWYKKVEITA